jgi:hypothetical protein
MDLRLAFTGILRDTSFIGNCYLKFPLFPSYDPETCPNRLGILRNPNFETRFLFTSFYNILLSGIAMYRTGLSIFSLLCNE